MCLCICAFTPLLVLDDDEESTVNIAQTELEAAAAAIGASSVQKWASPVIADGNSIGCGVEFKSSCVVPDHNSFPDAMTFVFQESVRTRWRRQF